MPFLIAKTNITLTDEQEAQLVSGLGKAIEHIPGVTEDSLMLCFEASAHLYLRGDNSHPMAYITVDVFNNLRHSGYERLSAAICRLFEDVLHMSPSRIYIKYEDIPSWSVAGRTFGKF